MKRFTTLLGFALVFAFVVGAFAAPAAYTSNNEGRTRVLVEFSPGKKAAVQKLLTSNGGQVQYEFDDFSTFSVTVPESAVAGLSHNPNIISIEEDAPRYLIGITPSASANVDLPAQVVPYGVDMVQARDVWDANRDGVVDAGAPTGSNRTICIIDSGFYTGHEDLSGVNASGYAGNLPWTQDYSGHGTHVGGTIAAMNNSLGVIGVTPGTVNIYSVRVFGDDGAWAYSSDLVDASNRCADAGANIISMSLGGGRKSKLEERAFDRHYANGILSIAAAGNDGTTTLSYPASYSSVVSVAAIDSAKVVADFSQKNSQVEIAAPGVGVLSSVPYLDMTTLTVGGMTYNAGHVEFSARGTTSGALVDGGLCDATGSWSGKVVLCERGVIAFYDKVTNVQNSGGVAAVIYNNVPGGFTGTLGDGNTSSIVGISLSQEDGQALVASSLGQTGTVESSYTALASGYEYYDGTSMATPHVSAVAALVWSADPSASASQVRDALISTAEDLGDPGRDNSYGYGLVQAATAITALTGGTPPSNTAPVLSITSPANGSSFDLGTNVTFSASATDAEDGDLSSSVSWASSIDGSLGTGASVTAALSVGTHTITASVTDSGNITVTKNVSVTITNGSSGGTLAVSVSTDQASYGSRGTAVITVHVTDGSASVAGASVNVSITTPNGQAYSGSGITNTNGDVSINFKFNTRKNGAGTYTVDATATATGYTSGSGSTTFAAQ